MLRLARLSPKNAHKSFTIKTHSRWPQALTHNRLARHSSSSCDGDARIPQDSQP